MMQMSDRYVPLSGSYKAAYFAGANTGEGFVSAYPDWIREEECHRVFIIKGGSGTGKSSIIKACAAAAEEVGAGVVLLLCSSDPTSADAVILEGRNGRRIAILDGTAPHTADPELPGAVGEIVDVGRYWDPSTLAYHREEITLARHGKQRAYHRAYRYLAAIREVEDGARSLLASCILREKMYAAVNRILPNTMDDEDFREEIRYTHALSMKGAYRLNTFASAERTYYVTDVYGTGEYFLSAVRECAARRRLAMYISPSPIDPRRMQEICLPHARMRFCLASPKTNRAVEDEGRIINMLRFIDHASLAVCRARLRFANACEEMLTDGALQALRDAGEEHFRLEEIYKSAMDFSGVEAETQRLCVYVREALQ